MTTPQRLRRLSLLTFFSGVGIGLLAGYRLQLSHYIQRELSSQSLADFQKAPPFLPEDNQSSVIRKLEKKNAELIHEYQRLRTEFEQVADQVQDRERLVLFRALEPLLMQLPVLAADIEAGIRINPADIVTMLKVLPKRLEKIEIEKIGEIGQETAFDPRQHVLPTSDTGLIEPGQAVIVFLPGYRYRDETLIQAEVRRTVPKNG